jgi:hypothetical protein
VTIFKRRGDPTHQEKNDMNRINELEGQITDIDAKIDDIAKKLSAVATRSVEKTAPTPAVDFNTLVDAAQLRDGSTRTEALTKARRENPDAFAAYRDGAIEKADSDFDVLVKTEMRRHCLPYGVAAQRVVSRYGVLPNAAHVEKRNASGAKFEDIVQKIARDEGCSQVEALTKARKQDP